MHIFTLNPLVQVLASISTICLRNSPKTVRLATWKISRWLATCAQQTIFRETFQHIVELEPETNTNGIWHEKMHLFALVQNWM